MTRLDHAKLARNSRPVQRDGAYSNRDNETPRTRKEAVGKWNKFDGQWVVSVVSTHSIPESKIIPVEKSDGTRKMVRLLSRQGSTQLQFARVDYYSFVQLDDALK